MVSWLTRSIFDTVGSLASTRAISCGDQPSFIHSSIRLHNARLCSLNALGRDRSIAARVAAR